MKKILLFIFIVLFSSSCSKEECIEQENITDIWYFVFVGNSSYLEITNTEIKGNLIENGTYVLNCNEVIVDPPSLNDTYSFKIVSVSESELIIDTGQTYRTYYR